MKHPLLKLAFMACSLVVFKQSNAQVSASFGPEIGFTASGLYDEDADVQAGLHGHIGGTAHIQFGRFFAVRPSVLFRTGTFQEDVEDDYKMTLHRLVVPVPVLFSYQFDNNGKIFVGAGPNFGLHLGGNVKDYNENKTKLKFGSSADDHLKKLDIGLHIKTGYQFGNGIALSLFFNNGFTNLNPASDYKVRSMDAIGFSFGWMFGGRNDDY